MGKEKTSWRAAPEARVEAPLRTVRLLGSAGRVIKKARREPRGPLKSPISPTIRLDKRPSSLYAPHFNSQQRAEALTDEP